MTPRELELAYRGYRKKTLEKWEMVRYSAAYIMSPHLKSGMLDDIDKKISLPSDYEKDQLYPKKKRKLDKSMIMKVTKVNG